MLGDEPNVRRIMSGGYREHGDFATLRERAEAKAMAGEGGGEGVPSSKEVQRLLHELEQFADVSSTASSASWGFS